MAVISGTTIGITSFQETYKEAYSLLESAKFVHAKQHQGDRDAIRHHVTQMDGLLHHVQGELRPWSRNHARQVGSGEIIEKSSAVEQFCITCAMTSVSNHTVTT